MKIIRVLLTLFVGICFPITSGISHAATVDVPVSAIVAAGTLTLTKTADLNFGSIVSGTAASTITINASAGAATSALSSGNASVTGGTSGSIAVSTNIDATVTIGYSMKGSNGITTEQIDDGAGGHTMVITNSSITTNSTGLSLPITVAGPNVIHVGGVLEVGANQAAATYTGTCTVTVNY